MKIIKKRSVCLVILGILLTLICALGLSTFDSANADSSAYSFSFENYAVKYDISSDKRINVEEKIEIHFTGYMSTGFIKDIPVNGGEIIKNIKVSEIIGGAEKSVSYDVYFEENDFVSVDIGDSSRKTGETHTYLITYDYYIPKAQEGKNKLDLNVIGYARSGKIERATVTVLTPLGLKSVKCVYGGRGSTNPLEYTSTEKNGKIELVMSEFGLSSYQGVSCNLTFDDGVLTNYSASVKDTSDQYWAVGIGAAILLVLILLKIFVFKEQRILPVIFYSAPDNMDPMKMGKLIDNNVGGSDVTSLIFYWASKNYIKINLDDKNDPILIRVVNSLPQDTPDYEAKIFYGLFKSGDMVKTSSLENKFYKTVSAATTMLNKKTKNLYNKKSFSASVAFMVIAALFLGLVPLFTAFKISSKLLFFQGFIWAVPAAIAYVILLGAKFYSLKLKKIYTVLIYAGITLAWAICLAIYCFVIPNTVLTLAPKILIGIIAYAIILVSNTCILRTSEYTKKLGDILGFKQFITLAQKHELETMLEENPQLYYEILPYAQVLGVSDIWQDKFKGLTIEPPSWASGNFASSYFDFIILNSLINTALHKVSTSIVSRPSGSGGFGGFGSGGVGGGHGGGGFRGR